MFGTGLKSANEPYFCKPYPSKFFVIIYMYILNDKFNSKLIKS